MCNPACCRSGRQRLAFSSTRKSLSPLIQVLPFAAQTVLRPRYYAGHAAQISKAPGTQTHYVTTATVKGYFIKLKGTFMSPIETMLKKTQKIPSDCLVLVCLFMSFHKLLLPPAFQQSCWLTAQKSFVSHQTSDPCPTTAAREINYISHKSRVQFAQTGCRILYNLVVKTSKIHKNN